MFLESFRHIIEIEALKKQNEDNLKRISSENKRISDLVERRNNSKINIENLQGQDKALGLNETQRLVEALQSRLQKLNAQQNLAVTEKERAAFENQILSVGQEKDQAESHYFENLEKSEEILAQIEHLKEFIAGSKATLETITAEVAQAVEKENLVIENRNKRIAALLELLQPEVLQLYKQIEKQKFKPTVSYLVGRNCSECHIQIDSSMKTTLEQGASLESCPNCGRMLLPETTRMY